MLKSLLSIAALTAAATVAVPAAASAAPAQVTANVNLRAGPGTQYYPILVLPAGAPIELYGCLQGYTWCDISYGRERGWVSSRYISTFYSGPVYRPRPYASVPFLTFNFGYWDNHYAHRPWYNNRPRDWDRNPDWGRPRPDWDRDRRDWDRDRQRQDWDRDRQRQDWERDRQRQEMERDRQRQEMERQRQREQWQRDRQRQDWQRDRDNQGWQRDRDRPRDNNRVQGTAPLCDNGALFCESN